MTDLEDDTSSPPPPRRRGSAMLLLVLGIVAVVAIVAYIVRLPAVRLHLPGTATEVAPPDPHLGTLQTQLDALTARVAVLELRPAPTAQPIAPPAAAPTAPPPDTALLGRLDALSARADRSDAQSSLALASLDTRLRTDEHKLAATSDQAQAIAALQARVQSLFQARAMEAALTTGQPIGAAQGLPAALARYATTAPPTESQLRLQYPAAEAAARHAARTGAGRLGVWHAIRARIAALVTIRRDGRLVAGNPQVGILEDANDRLNAGDLAGAVSLLTTLDVPAQQSMANWLDQARALLAARAALAQVH